MMQWRQGDVLVQRIEMVPDGARPRPDTVLFRGEATGHAHRLAAGAGAAVLELDDALFLSIGGDGATLIHDEHGPIPLEAGSYRVWRQREWDPRARTTRAVED
jgi:hypothetical protein